MIKLCQCRRHDVGGGWAAFPRIIHTRERCGQYRQLDAVRKEAKWCVAFLIITWHDGTQTKVGLYA